RREALGALRDGLRLSAHDQQDSRGLPAGERREGRGYLDQLYALRFLRLADPRGRHQEVRLGRQEDSGRVYHQRRRQRALLQRTWEPEDFGGGHSGRRLLGWRGGAIGPRHQTARWPLGRLELL